MVTKVSLYQVHSVDRGQGCFITFLLWPQPTDLQSSKQPLASVSLRRRSPSLRTLSHKDSGAMSSQGGGGEAGSHAELCSQSTDTEESQPGGQHRRETRPNPRVLCVTIPTPHPPCPRKQPRPVVGSEAWPAACHCPLKNKKFPLFWD